MNVYLKGKTITQMFNYTISLSTDNKFLKLKDQYNTKIFKRN